MFDHGAVGFEILHRKGAPSLNFPFFVSHLYILYGAFSFDTGKKLDFLICVYFSSDIGCVMC